MSDLPAEAQRIDRIRALVARFPKEPGVYLMKDDKGRVLYVGKAKDLRARVSSYFQASADLLSSRGPEIASMAAQVEDIDFLECDTEVDALLQENRLIKDIQPPYNERLKDGKTFPYIEITTRDDYPGVFITRTPRAKGTKIYGPFTSVNDLRDAVNALQKVFKFRTCELDIREDDDKKRFFRPCLLYNIKQCTAPCADKISREDYKKDIERFKRFLNSKQSTVLREMEKEMQALSTELRFEEAARIRDRIKAIQKLNLGRTDTLEWQPESFYIDPAKGLARLAKVLELDEPPRIIEGIDIANLQGQETVGSLVCFIDGRPLKAGYRRFRIKSVEGIDDYASIREVVRRRYRRAGGGEEMYPDVILIDGGLGQLHAAMEAVEDHFVKPPMVISLAKREEEIYVQARKQPIRLPRTDEGLRILQQVRDEAHRFAQHYHHILRAKRQFDEDVNAGKRPPKRKKKKNARKTDAGLNRKKGERVVEIEQEIPLDVIDNDLPPIDAYDVDAPPPEEEMQRHPEVD